MASQNEVRANQVINNLLALRQGLDSVSGDVDQELESAEGVNADLRNQIRGVDTKPKVVYVEDTEALRHLEREIDGLRRENESLRDQ